MLRVPTVPFVLALTTACAASPAPPPVAPVREHAESAGPAATGLPVTAGTPVTAISMAALSSESKPDTKPDLAIVHRIKSEAYDRGRVMDHLFWLTDVNGPRLTASPGFRTASEWAMRSLSSWGVTHPHLESWGQFGRPWTVQKFELSLVAPTYARIAGVPKAWSRGTNGPVTTTTVFAPFYPDKEDSDDGLDLVKLEARIRNYRESWKGKLRGRFVLFSALRDLSLPHEADAARYDDKKLGEFGQAVEHVPEERWTWPLARLPRDPKKRRALFAQLPQPVLEEYFNHHRRVMHELWNFFIEEGVDGVLSTDERGEGALLFAESTREWEARNRLPPPAIVLSPEDYDRLARLSTRSVEARLRLDEVVATEDKDVEGENVVAEIPGTKRPDEVVILGAHLDSWHAGTGATDNAAGCAVMMESLRILKAQNLPLDRTVRLVLWSGEEQGLYGSRGYVRQHFGDPVTMALLPEHAKVSAYFNLDNGSGRIRGIYLQNNDMARPIFESWLAPFKDEGATTVTLKNTGSTDHISFDSVGIPAFQFIQDPLDYMSRTHHSNLDVYEHAQPGDLMQAAAIVAHFAYQAANRADLLPRKLPPSPVPKQSP